MFYLVDMNYNLSFITRYKGLEGDMEVPLPHGTLVIIIER